MSERRNRAAVVADHVASIAGLLGGPVAGVVGLTVADLIDRSGERTEGQSYEEFLEDRLKVIERMGTVDSTDFRRRAKAGLERKERSGG